MTTRYTLLGICQQGATEFIALLHDAECDTYACAFADRGWNWQKPQPVNMPSGVTPGPGLMIGTENTLEFYWQKASGDMGHIRSKNDGKDWV